MKFSLNGYMRRVVSRHNHMVDAIIGVLICAWSACLLAIIYSGEHPPAMLPLGFIALVLCVARAFGMTAGMIGCIAAALILAMFAYQPIGSFVVADRGARANIAWMILGGLCLARLFCRPNARVPWRRTAHPQV